MKSLFFLAPLALLISFLALSCEEPLLLESGVWRLKTIYADPAPIDVPGSLPKPVTLRFQDGKINGHGGCNGYGGTYSTSGNELSVSQIMSTKMYCEGASNYENAFFQSLQNAKSYRIKGNSLEIDCADSGSLLFDHMGE